MKINIKYCQDCGWRHENLDKELDHIGEYYICPITRWKVYSEEDENE